MKTFLKFFAGMAFTFCLLFVYFYRTPVERAFAQHLHEAQQGDTAAMFAVAQDYLHGSGTKPNLQQGEQWLSQAAAKGYVLADWELFRFYTQHPQLPDAPANALVYLQAAAQHDLPPALYEMGHLYEQGTQVPQHAGQALFWYTRAAQKGSAAAPEKIAALTAQAPQLAPQMDAFMKNLQATQQNDPAAMFAVAQAYRTGTPVVQDSLAALDWMKQSWEASNHTFAQAAYELSAMYAAGEGTSKEDSQATHLLAQAAQLGYPPAQYKLGEQAYADNPPRLEDAFAWFSNAAAQGYSQGQYMTGFMLLQGQGTQKSVPLARRFFEQAAEQNNADAQYVLGQIYTKGLGVKRNSKRGRLLLQQAAENGHEAARAWLAQ